jgi:hypothetical protein
MAPATRRPAFRLARCAICCGIVLAASIAGFTQDKPAENKKAAAKKGDKKSGEKEAEPSPVNPWNRPEGSIVKKTARYYIWYDSNGWHLRACSIRLRNFHGTLRVTDGKVKSCVPVGLKERTKVKDAWAVNEDRSELKFAFSTSTASDGLDIRIEGDDAQLEFDLNIDQERAPKVIYLGRSEEHPAKNPFTLPAVPPKPPKDDDK